MGNALTQLASESGIHDQVAGVVLFGYTKNKENGGKIADFPEEKTRVYCETGDLVCYGILFTLPSHFMYPDDAAIAAPIFLRGRVDVAKQAGGWWKD
ncbi:cutinase family protein [Candidatus Bathyarchaeota archaeon]|nr:cutinase family protein [Candidatus Bathyarchaeota archaeon]